MSTLSDDVLPLIRTRAELFYRAANAHGTQMHGAVDILERAHIENDDPGEVHRVTQKAVASSMKIIARADDSAGIIGDACRRLLELHPRTAAAAQITPSKLVAWMMKFQFEGDVDFFMIDPVRYALALGTHGVESYRSRLTERAERLGIDPLAERDVHQPYSHEHFVLHWQAQRLAVLDQDVEMIIRTHARDKRVAAWFQNTAEALEEIGQLDLAVEWAQRAAGFDRGHQSVQAAEYWCGLLARPRPDELMEARWWVFDRWPNSTTATRLHGEAGTSWPAYQDAVLERLSANPREAVLFQLHALKDPAAAWETAHAAKMSNQDVWERLVQQYQSIDPLAVLPILSELVDLELLQTGAAHYKNAARHLKTMRRLSTGTNALAEVDTFISDLRETNRRRPRLQKEFTRAGLP
ncbi:MAG: hypothetical protein L0I94_03800 [Yaniella sp.]|nr:hypothetical protein [Yaniella sp.]